MAYAGVSCYAKQLRSFVQKMQHVRLPSSCFLADDVVATHYFKNVYNYNLRRVVLRKKNTDDHSVWRSKSSINAFHVANHNGINLKCEQALTKGKQWHGVVPRHRRCAVDPRSVTPVFGRTSPGAAWWQTYWEPCVGWKSRRANWWWRKMGVQSRHFAA